MLRATFLRAPQSLCCRTLPERLHSLFFLVVHLKYSQQLGNLQEVTDALREMCELDGSASIVRSGVQRNKCSQPAAIDVSDAGKVQNDPIMVGEKIFQLVS